MGSHSWLIFVFLLSVHPPLSSTQKNVLFRPAIRYDRPAWRHLPRPDYRRCAALWCCSPCPPAASMPCSLVSHIAGSVTAIPVSECQKISGLCAECWPDVCPMPGSRASLLCRRTVSSRVTTHLQNSSLNRAFTSGLSYLLRSPVLFSCVTGRNSTFFNGVFSTEIPRAHGKAVSQVSVKMTIGE